MPAIITLTITLLCRVITSRLSLASAPMRPPSLDISERNRFGEFVDVLAVELWHFLDRRDVRKRAVGLPVGHDRIGLRRREAQHGANLGAWRGVDEHLAVG